MRGWNAPAGGEVALSLQGADTGTVIISETLLVYKFQALTCTDILEIFVHSLTEEGKWTAVVIYFDDNNKKNVKCCLSEFSNHAQGAILSEYDVMFVQQTKHFPALISVPPPFSFTFAPSMLYNSNHLIWLITAQAPDLTSKPQTHHWFTLFVCSSLWEWMMSFNDLTVFFVSQQSIFKTRVQLGTICICFLLYLVSRMGSVWGRSWPRASWLPTAWEDPTITPLRGELALRRGEETLARLLHREPNYREKPGQDDSLYHCIHSITMTYIIMESYLTAFTVNNH